MPAPSLNELEANQIAREHDVEYLATAILEGFVPDSPALTRTVMLGERYGSDVEVLSGLAAGDTVVLP